MMPSVFVQTFEPGTADPVLAGVEKLDEPLRDDGDGELLPPGTPVLRNRLAPRTVRKADDRNRRLFAELGFAWDRSTRAATWQPEMSAEIAAAVSHATGLAESFTAAVETNLYERIGHKLPVKRMPVSAILLPIRLTIKSAEPSADLTGPLTDAMIAAGGLPTDCPPTPATLTACNSVNCLSVVELHGLLGPPVHVVIAFVVPVRFAPFIGMSLQTADPAAVAVVRAVYQSWATGRPAGRVYFAIGSMRASDGIATESARAVTTMATPGDEPGRWVFKAPPVGAHSPVADFVEALRPETRDARAVVVARAVRTRLTSGFQGNVDADWLARQTGYSTHTVHVAMRDLADAGTHRLETSPSGAHCITPLRTPSGKARRPRSTGGNRRGYWLRFAIGTTASWALSMGAARLVHGIHWPAVGAAAGAPFAWASLAINNFYTRRLSD